MQTTQKNSANGIFLDGELTQNVLYYFLLYVTYFNERRINK